MTYRKSLLLHSGVNVAMLLAGMAIGTDYVILFGSMSVVISILLLLFFFDLSNSNDKLLSVAKWAYHTLPPQDRPFMEEAIYKAGFCPSATLDDNLEPR